jgi:hypothetical protein
MTTQSNKPALIQGIDYYINAEGKYVFTEHYLLKRGRCCSNGCLHCPYGYKKPIALKGPTHEKQ